MPVITSQELSLHYQHSVPKTPNDHAPVLLLAGMASDSASWQPLVQGLHNDYELILPDNRCTGQTLPNPVHTDRDCMLSDIVRLLDTLEIERVSVVGHSMGGMLGWALASMAPDRVQHLVAAAALPNVINARIELFESLSVLRTEQNEAQWFRLLYQFLFHPSFFNDKATVDFAVNASMSYPHKQSAASFAMQVAGLSSFLSMPDIHAINGKVTLVTGSHDVLTTPAMIEQFAADKTFVNTVIIDDASHALHWEQTERFVNIVQEALAEPLAP